MESINLEKSTQLIKSFLEKNLLLDFLGSDPNIYIGGSLPFMCLSPKIIDSSSIEVGDIDIYTKNCPFLLRNLNKTYKLTNIEKTGVNVKFNIEENEIESIIPIQIITSSFDNFNDEILDEYDCGMVAVGYHPYSSQFIINKRFLEQLKKNEFEVIHKRTNPSRIKKLKKRAIELFNARLIEINLDSNTDYRPYWKNTDYRPYSENTDYRPYSENTDYRPYSENTASISSINDIMPSPPYTQLYANKYHCMCCSEKQDYLICKLCEHKISTSFTNSIEKKKIIEKYKRVVVIGGLNGMGKIIADEIIQIGENNIEVSRTGKDGKEEINTFSFDLETYVMNYENAKLNKKVKIINPELLIKILEADLVIFNGYQTLEDDQLICNTNLNNFNIELSEKIFKINCWGYTWLLQEILEERKKYINNNINSKNTIQDQIFVWIDGNELPFENKLYDGKHLEINMAKTACKQIFYTNANIMAGMGILFLCWDCGWCYYQGMSVSKNASRSKYLVPPKLSTLALLYYLDQLDIDKLYEEKKYIHDMTFNKCISNINVDFDNMILSKKLY